MANWQHFNSLALRGTTILVNLDRATIIRADLDNVGTLLYFADDEPVHLDIGYEAIQKLLGKTEVVCDPLPE